MSSDLNQRFAAIHARITRGELGEALVEAEALLAEYERIPTVVGNCAGFFIDIGAGKRDAALVRRGTDLLRSLVGKALDAHEKRSFSYNLANGLSELGRLAVDAAGRSYWGVAESEDFQEGKLLLTDLLENEGAPAPPEVWTNYGNTLSLLGRSVEALYAFDQALRSSPGHSMARGNKGEALAAIAPLLGGFYSGTLREAGRLLAQAIGDPRLAEIGAVTSARIWRDRLGRIEERLGIQFTGDERPGHPPANLSGLTTEVRRFVELCRDERLFLTYHVVDEQADVALRDAVFIGMLDRVGAEGRFDRLATLFNQIKESYVAARYQFFLSGERDADRDAVSSLTSFADVGDGALVHLYGGLLKSAFGEAYNVLDKIAFFLNDYLSLGIAEKKVSFRVLWRHPEDLRPRRPGLDCRVHPDLRGREDPGVVALVDIARDLERARFKRIRDIRHALTHRCLVLKREEGSSPARPGVKTMQWTSMRRETLQLLRMVKSAIFSLAALVTVEERRMLGEEPTLVERRDVPTGRKIDVPE